MIKVLHPDAAVAVAVSSTSLILMWCWRAIGIIFVCPHFRLVSPNDAPGKGLNECVLQLRRIHKVNFCQATSSNRFSHLIFLGPCTPKCVSNVANIQSWNCWQNCTCHELSISLNKETFFLFFFLLFHNFHMLRSFTNSIMMKSYCLPSLWQRFHDAYVVNPQAGLDSIAMSIFADILVVLTNTMFVNSTNISRNIEIIADISHNHKTSGGVLFLSWCTF